MNEVDRIFSSIRLRAPRWRVTFRDGSCRDYEAKIETGKGFVIFQGMAGARIIWHPQSLVERIDSWPEADEPADFNPEVL